MSTSEDKLREQIARIILGTQTEAGTVDHYVNENATPWKSCLRTADALLPLFAASRVAALEEAAEIAESRHLLPVGASTDGSVTYQSTARFPDDGRRIAAAIRAAKEETP